MDKRKREGFPRRGNSTCKDDQGEDKELCVCVCVCACVRWAGSGSSREVCSRGQENVEVMCLGQGFCRSVVNT